MKTSCVTRSLFVSPCAINGDAELNAMYENVIIKA